MPDTAQPAPETHEKKSRGLGSYVVWGLLALMLYVLSSGPVVRLMHQRQTKKFQKLAPGAKGIDMTLLDNVVGFIYGPLNWAYNTDTFHKPLGLYWHLWSRSFHKEGE